MSTSKARRSEPAEIVQLAGEYADIQGHPAWQDFQARLESIRLMLERGILQGEVDRLGVDITPDLRSAYGIVLQMLSVPAEIEQQKALAEEQILGISPAESRGMVDTFQ